MEEAVASDFSSSGQVRLSEYEEEVDFVNNLCSVDSICVWRRLLHLT